MFFIGQTLGGFVGAGVVYANYISSIDMYENGARTVPPSPTATAGIFCTYPQAQLTKASQFFSEFIASAILMFVIFALKDDSNKGSFSASGEWFPLGLFFLIFGLGSCFGESITFFLPMPEFDYSDANTTPRLANRLRHQPCP